MQTAPSGTVHIVDDDPSVLRSLARLLRAEGLEARAWNSAAEFLAAEGALQLPACLVLEGKGIPEPLGFGVHHPRACPLGSSQANP
jgi:FixJ family two-component response regulator